MVLLYVLHISIWGKKLKNKIEQPMASILFLYNADINKFLSVSRKDNGKIAVPGGKLESQEMPREAIKRELFEETNLSIDKDKLLFVLQCKDDHNHIVSVYFSRYSEKEHGTPSSMEQNGYVSWETLEDLQNERICEFPTLNLIVGSIIKSKAYIEDYSLHDNQEVSISI